MDGETRERARDKGLVKSLGVEVTAAIDEALERCRAAKKWTRRVLVEEALRQFLTGEGFPPEDPAPTPAPPEPPRRPRGRPRKTA